MTVQRRVRYARTYPREEATRIVAVRDYYAQRHGARRPADDIESLRGIVAAEYLRLEQAGYFQWHLGYYCVDAGDVPGRSAGVDPRAYVRWHLGQDLWPFHESLPVLGEEWLFTALEFLHDHAAEPTQFRHHTFGDCGIHVQSADETAGRDVFRASINRYLRQYRSGFEMQENGEIWTSAPTGLEDRRPLATGRDDVDLRVAHAVGIFRRHNATDEDKRDAIRNLADILEPLRSGAGTGLPTEEEDRLFEIANRFGIRHHNSKQGTAYDTDIWFDWVFYSFLNAVALFTELTARDARASAARGPKLDDLPF